MEEGQIALAPMPQQDGKLKDRPIVLLKKLPYADDWLACGISSKTFREIRGFDVLIDETHPDFKRSNLAHKGLIRLSFLSSIPENQIKNVVGDISAKTHKSLLANLVKLLKKK